jgi:hypothetical protein
MFQTYKKPVEKLNDGKPVEKLNDEFYFFAFWRIFLKHFPS